ncbi:type II secretion system F family protein [Dactylosporangium sp. NPDC048998]|uniref:type II secretion system F family protein n=1 Tax=Dactylosporangium sp. NPDC048998 TaxID=3363976 RepID=UPI0037142E41
MSALDLAIAAGVALTAGWVAYWLRRRRAATRLARLTRVSAAGSDAVPGGRVARRTRHGDLGRRAGVALLRRPVTAGGAVIALLSGAALLLAGPVAAVVAALYALMALVTVRRRLVRQEAERRVAALLDAVDATAEGLRAGTIQDGAAAQTSTSAQTPKTNALVPKAAGGKAGDGDRGAAAVRHGRWAEAAAEVAQARLEAAYRLSEALGVPLADLLDRVDADLRSGQALRGGVAAQLSAAQATTAVLLALPLAGLWVGAALNTHPVRQLLHTPLGAACAVVAVALQCGGFLWTARMVHAATTEVR